MTSITAKVIVSFESTMAHVCNTCSAEQAPVYNRSRLPSATEVNVTRWRRRRQVHMASGGGVLAFLSARMTAPQGGARTLCVTAAAAATVDVQAVKERLPDSGWGTPRPASLPQTDFAIFSAYFPRHLKLVCGCRSRFLTKWRAIAMGRKRVASFLLLLYCI